MPELEKVKLEAPVMVGPELTAIKTRLVVATSIMLMNHRCESRS